MLCINFIFQRLFLLNHRCKTSVHFTSVILCAENLRIGQYSGKSLALSPNLYIQAHNGIEIGKNVLIGPNVSIISADHDLKLRSNWKKNPPIKIGSNVWIGTNATILPGSTVSDGCIIGANSLVKGTFPENTLIAGNPAVVKRNYDN